MKGSLGRAERFKHWYLLPPSRNWKKPEATTATEREIQRGQNMRRIEAIQIAKREKAEIEYLEVM